MWGIKTIPVLVVIGALKVVKKGIEKHTDKIPGEIKITESTLIINNDIAKTEYDNSMQDINFKYRNKPRKTI